MQAANSLATTALRYAARGIAVLPLHSPTASGCTCDLGSGCATAGKHPRLRHGLHDAFTDPRLIRYWWCRWPQANIARPPAPLPAAATSTPTPPWPWTDLGPLDVRPTPRPVVCTGHGWHLR